MAVKTYLKVIAGILLATAIVATAMVILVPRLLDLETYKTQILSAAQNALNRRVSYESASYSWQVTPSFVVRGITVAEKSGDAVFLKVDRLTFRLALLPLIHKEVRLKEIVVERPEITLGRDRAGAFTIDDLFTGKPSAFSIDLRSVRITDGLVRFTDRLVDPEGFTTSLEKLDLYVSKVAKGKTSAFRFSAMMPDGKGHAAIAASGTARIPGDKESLSDATFDITLSAKDFGPGRFWPYYGQHLPFEKTDGVIDFEGGFKGKSREFTAKGDLRIRDLRLTYPQVFHAVLTPKEVRLAYELDVTPRDLSVKSFDLTVDGLRATGNWALRDFPAKDPHISARVATSPFRLEDFRRYIPYGIIAKGVADFIEQHIGGGIYRLDEGRLDGKMSQILHMERGDNYNVLYVRARVDQGVVTVTPQTPVLNGIKGDIEMRGKDFLVRNVTGNFGGSPFTLEGKITDYPLDTPSGYPFTMTMTPGKDEVAWLFRQRPSAMAFSGRSVLHLSGSGSTGDYRLDGSWDLTGADYGYRQLIHKPSGIANRIRFAARLGDAAANLTDVRYELASLDVTASASYQYNTPDPLTFEFATNHFPVSPLLPIVPVLQKYHPSGTLQARFSGSGNPAKSDEFRLKGDVHLSQVSGRPFKQIEPLSGITGTIHVTEATLETAELTGSVGKTQFAVKGHVAGFSDPTASFAFSSPELHPEDFGYRANGDVEVKNLSGSSSLAKGNLSIASLSGEVNRTKFSVTGEVIDFTAPKKIAMHVDFPYLRVEDLAPLARLKRSGEEEEGPSGITLNARVTSAEGSAGDIHFQRLDTQLSLEADRLIVQALSAGVFGGIVSGNGRVAFTAVGGPMYQAHYHMDRVDTAQLLRATGAQPYLTGSLTAEGVATGHGTTLKELVKTAQTSAMIHLQKGELTPPASFEGGGVSQIPYTVLDAHLLLQKDVLTLQWVNAEIFGGTVSGNGRIDLGADSGPAYQARYRLDRVDIPQLLRAAGIQRELTGQVTAEGTLTFRGNNAEEVKSSVKGNAELTLTGGKLYLPATGDLKTPHEFPFKKVQTRLSFDRKVLDIHSFGMETFGGVISGDGQADFSLPNEPGYRLTCQLKNIDAGDFFRAFDVTREVTGHLNLQAEVTAKGASVTALKETVKGTVAAHLEKGVIKRYGFISKVFSVLNVSQLLDFSLPDVVTSGMPYDRIDMTSSLLGGKGTTRDFSIHTPSLNMTVVGEVDIVKREIDAKIGVQPLQTVGKVVRRIPIIGWLLTGGKKSFLVVYYEAKGKWEDPTVSTIPQTAISSGLLNIFKRTLNLPDALISKPGKVLLGN